MTAFDAMLGVLFADPHLAKDAVWRAGGSDPGRAIRAIAIRPEIIQTFGETRLRTPSSIFEIRKADVEAPAAGDTIEIDGVVYKVQGLPALDPERLVWRLDCTKA